MLAVWGRQPFIIVVSFAASLTGQFSLTSCVIEIVGLSRNCSFWNGTFIVTDCSCDHFLLDLKVFRLEFGHFILIQGLSMQIQTWTCFRCILATSNTNDSKFVLRSMNLRNLQDYASRAISDGDHARWASRSCCGQRFVYSDLKVITICYVNWWRNFLVAKLLVNVASFVT